MHFLKMDGADVFKVAVRTMDLAVREIVAQAGLQVTDISCLIPHQANIRIIDAAMQNLKIAEDKVFCNVHKYGNTSGASVPLVLDEALRAGKIRRGDLILMCGFGAGLSWGTGLYRW